jgi:hypothetical protein
VVANENCEVENCEVENCEVEKIAKLNGLVMVRCWSGVGPVLSGDGPVMVWWWSGDGSGVVRCMRLPFERLKTFFMYILI